MFFNVFQHIFFEVCIPFIGQRTEIILEQSCKTHEDSFEDKAFTIAEKKSGSIVFKTFSLKIISETPVIFF